MSVFSWINLLSFVWLLRTFSGAAPVVNLKTSDIELSLDNGYIQVVFDRIQPSLSVISADFLGEGNFSVNVLSDPFALETVFSADTPCVRASGNSTSATEYSLIENSTSKVQLEISQIWDCLSHPVAAETWLITMEQGRRLFDLRILGSVQRAARIVSIGHTLYSASSSVNGLFDLGVAQMMQHDNACLGSTEAIGRAYFVGNGVALDLLRVDNNLDAKSKNNSSSETTSSTTVLFSKASSTSSLRFVSGYQDVILGQFPYESSEDPTPWSENCWSNADSTWVYPGYSWDISFQFGPNNADFPIYGLLDVDTETESSLGMPYTDIQTFLTGAYAAAAGCLQSFYRNRGGTIAPTVAHPDVGYSPDTNFFDPDNFITLSAMMYSGDTYLWDQVRQVLERTAQTMCGSSGTDQLEAYCDVPLEHPLRSGGRILSRGAKQRVAELAESLPRTGQLMHHFVDLVPTYESIAGSEQLGPNIFWTLCALRYASITSDLEWLDSMFEFVDKSSLFLSTFYDEEVGLLSSPGPLWIDVLVRENYTSDSNAIAPMVFNTIADAFDVVNAYRLHHDKSLVLPSIPAADLRRMANTITENMNKVLWQGTDNDHYVTQLDPDGAIRDFVDYDANLLAVAFGVAPESRVPNLLQRVDSGEHTHIRATWCCEIEYSGDAEDCYIVGGDVCGDSVVTLARIGWADALARKRVGDVETFDKLLLKPLQEDVVQDTWLYERYDADGNQIRTAYYFEYPSVVTMMLTEVRYGISINLGSIVVDPFPSTGSFLFSFGILRIQYSQDCVTIEIPGIGMPREVTVTGLYPSTTYSVWLSGDECVEQVRLSDQARTVTSSTDGTLSTAVTTWSGCVVHIDHLQE